MVEPRAMPWAGQSRAFSPEVCGLKGRDYLAQGNALGDGFGQEKLEA
jgi:hypothetical protein